MSEINFELIDQRIFKIYFYQVLANKSKDTIQYQHLLYHNFMQPQKCLFILGTTSIQIFKNKSIKMQFILKLIDSFFVRNK
ncbi:unnamed protein product [Paramecium pentaurelia]|uniref:Uncharacterized protein n=1 Tax=Paramecium pentaurelia TaxID=43138 RepID=A0A8S1WAQ5_9CILI|nr:unnamed protein product [Paramecium pentaurelia]